MKNITHKNILCCIPTKDRYLSTLPLTLLSIANQTLVPNEVIIFDDSENIIDIRNNDILKNILILFDCRGIKWSVIFGRHMGPHFSHQMAQELASDLIWRIDDDEIAEPNVLETLYREIEKDQNIGAVAGLVLMPNAIAKECLDNPINDLSDNCQWYKWNGRKEVQHLYSSFLYRKGISDYELSLSKAAHREETIFTHRMYRKGFKLIVTSEAVTWHLRNENGGIRNNKKEFFDHDEKIFQEIKREWNGDMICYLDNGKGDHVVFKSILPQIKEKYKKVRIACCYKELFECEDTMSIEEGKLFVNPDRFNIYKFMYDRNWKSELVDAFKKMYLEI